MGCFEALASGNQRRGVLAALALLVGIVLLAGCRRSAEEQYALSPQVEQLEPELRQQVERQLIKYCGTPSRPLLLGGSKQDERELEHGEAIYRQNCQQCHGVTGDGNGPAAQYLTPRPRDFRRGIFKFTSTPYGFKPRRGDLLRTVQQGVVGTAMPSFRLLPERDREAVVEYVLALTHRGELERLLAAQADAEGEVTDEGTTALVKNLLGQWKESSDKVVEPATPMPPITPETIAAGKAIFEKRECFKCHGRDGRGGLAGGIEVGNDAWGRKDPAADLTSGMLHGGQMPLDIYRRISSGINGTPMPAFKEALASEPETIWDLTHYVLSLADQRRRGVQFPPGKAAVKESPDSETAKSDKAESEKPDNEKAEDENPDSESAPKQPEP